MEGNKPDEIDQFFKDSLQSFREMPPEGVWENIEQELDDDDRRIFLIRIRYSLLVSACLLVLWFSLGLLFRQDHPSVKLRSPKAVDGANAGSVAGGGAESSVNGQAGGPGAAGGLDGVRGAGEVRGSDEAGRSEGTGGSDEARGSDEVRGAGGARGAGGSGGAGAVDRAVWSITRQPLASRAGTSGPDPNQQLLRDQISRFKTTSHTDAPLLPGRWSVTGYFSKEFAGYSLSDHDSTGANGREIDKKERSVFSASAVILFSYRLKARWVIQSGLSYSWSNSIANPTTSYAVKDNNGNIQFQVNTLSGYGYLPVSTSGTTQVGDSVLTDKSHTSLRYLSLPLMVSREFQLKRFRFLTGIGVTANLLTSATLTSKIQGPSYSQHESVVRMYGLEKLNYGVAFKAELQYPLYQGWWIDLMASFKNTLTPINMHSTLSTYPYNLGIGLGISHSF